MDTVCCVILNYNDAETTIKLLNMIKSYKSLSHIVVVDNCSSDNSIIQLSAFEDNPKIRVIQSNHNGGYGAGNNLGINFAYNVLHSDYVLLSNPDVIFTDELVYKMMEQFEKDYSIAASTAVQFDIDHKPIPAIAWKIPSSLEYAVSATKLKNLYQSTYKYSDICNQEIIYVDCVPGALLMYDTAKFMEVGGYDEEMFLYCEEVTIAIKLKERGYKTVLLGKERYFHEHSVSVNKSINSKKRQSELLFNNRIYVMKKYLNASLLTISLCKLLNKMKLIKISKQERKRPIENV